MTDTAGDAAKETNDTVHPSSADMDVVSENDAGKKIDETGTTRTAEQTTSEIKAVAVKTPIPAPESTDAAADVSAVNATDTTGETAAAAVAATTTTTTSSNGSERKKEEETKKTPSAAADTAAVAAPSSDSAEAEENAQTNKQLKVEDALEYLEKVKKQFGKKPRIYNQFLEIMKNFKSQIIDTPGVIDAVSDLFQGHTNLILGFNTFLPPGFKIDVNQIRDRQRRKAAAAAASNTTGMQARMNNGNAYMVPNAASMAQNNMMYQQQMLYYGNQAMHPHMMQQFMSRQQHAMASTGYPKAVAGYPPSAHPSMYSHQQMLAQRQMHHHPSPAAAYAAMNAGVVAPNTVASGMPQTLSSNAGGVPPPDAPPAFDKAVHYVTRIKERFMDDQDGTYKQFLDILHTYQEEKKSIKEVLDRVAKLFRDHPDLLREFTFFLPDAVQAEAKARLGRVAAASQKRLQKANKRMRSKKSAGGPRPRKRGKRKGGEFVLPEPERRFFSRVKGALNRDQWGEFVKCIDLFCEEVISRQELLDLIKDLFLDHNEELYDQFNAVLEDRGVVENPMEEVWFSMPLSEIDFSQCRKCTPSYRALPSGYPVPPCSERSPMEQSVCNDNWVSVPTGSEDFAFKNARKNAYEEALFKGGDDRFEIDMVIESNASTIRLLEPLAKEIEQLRAESKTHFQFHLDRRSLSVIHLKAIARIYGDHGAEMLELLRKTPAGAIPVILKRLKQKDVEWRKEKREIEITWKELTERNAAKSVEHQNQWFRQHEKKMFSEKSLLNEARIMFEKNKRKVQRAIDAAQHAEMGMDHDDTEKSSCNFDRRSLPEIMAAPHMTWNFENLSVQRDVFALVEIAVQRSTNYSREEKIKMRKIYRKFLAQMLNFSSALVFDMQYARGLKAEATVERLSRSTSVTTPFGAGTIMTYRPYNDTYKVRLPFGIGFLGAKDVQRAHVASDDEGDREVAKPSHSMSTRRGGSTTTLASTPEEKDVATNDGNEDLMDEDDDVIFDEGESSTSSGTPSPTPGSGTVSPVPPNNSNMGAARQIRTVFFGSNAAYLFIRLYHKMIRRIDRVRKSCGGSAVVDPVEFVTQQSVGLDRSAFCRKPQQSHKDDYRRFLVLATQLVLRVLDANKFEKQCKLLIGRPAFGLIALEKLVNSFVTHLHTLACDASSKEYLDLYNSVSSANAQQNAGADGSAGSISKIKLGEYVTKVEDLFERISKTVENKDEGLFAFTSVEGVPFSKEASGPKKLIALADERAKCGIPPSIPDELGPKDGWVRPPCIEIRHRPGNEEDYSFIAALNQAADAGEENGDEDDVENDRIDVDGDVDVDVDMDE